jgi:hypothetical protein
MRALGALLVAVVVLLMTVPDRSPAATWEQVGEFAIEGSPGPSPRLDRDGLWVIEYSQTFGAGISRYGTNGGLQRRLQRQSPQDQNFPAQPRALAVDRGGNIVVTDVSDNCGQRCVFVFAPDGQLIRRFGPRGTGTGLLHYPSGVGVDSAGNYYVSDPNGHKVVKFASNGTFLTEWKDPEVRSVSGLWDPTGITVDPSDNVYVAQNTWTDDGAYGPFYSVYKFDTQGNLLATFGSGKGNSSGLTESVAVDAAGNVYADGGALARIHAYTPQGTPKLGFVPPISGIAVHFDVDPQGVVYLVDHQRRSIRKFALKLLPEAGRTAVASVLSGTVLVSRHSIRQTRMQASAASDLIPLTGPAELAIGALVDATRGALELLTAANLQRGTQKGEFSNGKFKLRQKRSSKPVTDVVLNKTLRCGKAKTGARSRSLAANARGRYRVVGRFATGSPRGRARWTTRDTCNATSIKVQAGKVTVRDLVKRRNVVVKKGRSYRARKSR